MAIQKGGASRPSADAKTALIQIIPSTPQNARRQNAITVKIIIVQQARNAQNT